jgi:hypothetical protein
MQRDAPNMNLVFDVCRS